MTHVVVQVGCLFNRQNLFKLIVEIEIVFLFMVKKQTQIHGKWRRLTWLLEE